MRGSLYGNSMRFPIGVIVAITVAALSVAAATAALTPIQFTAKPGWFVGTGSVHACPGVSATKCTRVTSWASTVRWRDCVDCLPHNTVGALPAGGVAIQVSLIRENPLTAKERLTWPPQVRAADLVSPFEGLPSRIAVYKRFARSGSNEVYVLVLFGRSRPDARQLALANAELRSAKLP
jgi:hypothetical protein